METCTVLSNLHNDVTKMNGLQVQLCRQSPEQILSRGVMSWAVTAQ